MLVVLVSSIPVVSAVPNRLVEARATVVVVEASRSGIVAHQPTLAAERTY